MNTQFLAELPQYIARALVLLLCIPVHEFSHAWVSFKLGDPTAKYQGRLTLNPLKHFDPIGCISMLVLGIGWAKPVPIDPRYYKNPKAGMAVSAAAGPLSNILMAFVSLILYKFCYYAYYTSGGSDFLYYISLLLVYMVTINIALGIFNLMPVPPFDGSRIFGAVLPDRAYWGIMRYERYIFLGVMLLLVLGVLDRPLYLAQNGLYTALDFLTRPVDYLAAALFGVPGAVSV
ncbi:MAG: site-2 protease family protein [Oscillospiraceae bacterium]|nr:site-2 protease family protein [Oscillospiraceae bacterium]